MSSLPASSTDVATPLLPTSLSPISLSWAGEAQPPTAPAKTGTILSSAMNLAACALGASMLSLPYTMLIAGPILSLQFLLFFALMAFFAAQAVVNAGLRAKKTSYPAIVAHYFGNAHGIIAHVLLASALIVAAISYIVGLADLLPDMLPFTSMLPRTPRIISILLVLFPATLIGALATFGPASALAAAGCYLQALALVAQLFTGGAEWHMPPTKVWTAADLGGLIYSLPMICFVYAFHYVLTETLVELRNPTRARMALVNAGAVGITLGCYIPVAVAGYLVYSGEGIGPNVLTGLPEGSVAGLVAEWSIGALLLITYGLFIIPLRQKLERMLFGELTRSMLDVRRLAVAGMLNVLVGVVSVSLPDLGLANTLAGGCIALIMFFFPGRLMVRYQLDVPAEQRDAVRLGIGMMFVAFGALICGVGLFGNLIFDY